MVEMIFYSILNQDHFLFDQYLDLRLCFIQIQNLKVDPLLKLPGQHGKGLAF